MRSLTDHLNGALEIFSMFAPLCVAVTVDIIRIIKKKM